MEPTEAERLLRNLDRRVERIEQFLPTRAGSDELAPLATQEKLDAAVARLASQEDLAAAIAPLATKAELAAAIAPLATKAELKAAFATLDERIREEGARTRSHFDAVAERMHDELRLIAEGHTTLDRRATQTDRTPKDHDKRLNKLETGMQAARRAKKR